MNISNQVKEFIKSLSLIHIAFLDTFPTIKNSRKFQANKRLQIYL